MDLHETSVADKKPSVAGAVLTQNDAIIFFSDNRGMKSKSECSCEPNMRELCMHCDHEKKQTQRAENNELCMIGYPHKSSNRCQDPNKLKANICTELGKKQGQVKCSSGLGIESLTLPRGLNNPSGYDSNCHFRLVREL